MQSFRELMRLHNVLKTFANFKFDDTNMASQEFEDYKSKYLDIHDSVKQQNEGEEKVSVLDDIDFELELIQRDEINVSYILNLLAELHQNEGDEGGFEKQKKAILDTLASEQKLRSKRDLISKFIEENLPKISDANEIEVEFMNFWKGERKKAFNEIVEEEGLIQEKAEKLVQDYLYTSRKPLRDDVMEALEKPPTLLQRKKIYDKVTNKITTFVEKFEEGI